MNTEFDKIKAGKHEDEALEELLGQYGRLAQMAELAGYPPNSADKWRKDGEAVDIRPLKKEMWKQRIRVYLTSAFAVFALIQVFWIVYNITAKPAAVIGNIIVLAADLFIASVPFRKYLKTEREAEGNRYDTDSYKYLRSRSDKYAKRLLNSIALLCRSDYHTL
ncbi:MAG: hypothetical protein J6X56_07115 [Ruminococcus sp.]|nr:hypothetical protein [Ruminococcus sp.]